MLHRHRLNRFFRGFDHHGEVQDRQGGGGPEQAGLAENRLKAHNPVYPEPDILNEEADPEKPENDRGDPGQVVHRHADCLSQAGGWGGVLGQVDPGQDPEGHQENCHDQDQENRTVDRRENSSLGHSFHRGGGEEFPGEGPGPIPGDGEDDPEEEGEDDQDAKTAGEREEFIPTFHVTPASLALNLSTTRLAKRLIIKVITNSKAPMKKSTA